LITAFSNTGQATLKHLLALGATDVTVGARNVAENKAKILAAGAKNVVELDLEKQETCVSAMKGIDRAVLTAGFQPGDLDKMVKFAQNFVAGAKANKVKFIARLSAVGADPKATTIAAPQGKADEIIKSAGIPYAVFEPNFFMSNALFNVQSIKASGQVHVAAGTGKTPYIHPDDIGAFFAAVLFNADKYANKTLKLAGAAAITDQELYNAVGRVIGKEIKVVDHSPEDYKKLLLGFGLPEKAVDTYVFLDVIRRNGWAGPADTEFEKIVGRKQQTHDDWARQNAAAFK